MYTNEKTAKVLNDLVRINNDRIAGYDKAAKETEAKDIDLQAVFRQMSAESRSYVNDLSKYVATSGKKVETDTTVAGKIYRTWMDVKATFSGKDRKSILASCEYGEDAAQKAYDTALSSDAELSTEIRQLIMDQKTSLKRSHDIIKKMRDAQPA
jgi:uncharacterized protein (TIGR02284 family)